MICDNEKCAEAVTVSGRTSVDVDFNHEGHPFLSTYYKILFAFPSPVPISMPIHTPDGVKSALIAAAGLLWATPDAAMNKLRQAVEAFLSAEKIPSTTTKKPRGRVRLSLHCRITRYGETPKGLPLASALLAAKWLGNAGSHDDGSASVTRDDVLLAFQVVEHVLDERYSDRRQKLLQQITAVNKKKGPVRPTRRKTRVKPPF
ncbi:DUF4145 domain-containing protein [Roseococcus suduntuyensis]|uniref:DUF4145 domain-containing protein n=1 Tax=Roseococcus suduntuyensis TaxID=455361 RepID=A0A840A7V2_9PROT|nr:DUF4145 domain-containing protein [Roseococcus suduntuyensis]MBB3897187.1 hypothetical protein [Roseococcus suduntuyensis]